MRSGARRPKMRMASGLEGRGVHRQTFCVLLLLFSLMNVGWRALVRGETSVSLLSRRPLEDQAVANAEAVRKRGIACKVYNST